MTHQRRATAALFTGVAAMNTAMAGASTAATLIASDALGSGWSGLPGAAGVLGTALGTLSAGTLIARRGSRVVLVGMYGCAVAGALVAFAAAVHAVLVVLLLGMLLLGLGNGAAQLSRYLAAELYPAGRRGFALSLIVWAGTVGAVVGPALIAPGAGLAGWLGFPSLAGPVLVAAVVTAFAAAASSVTRRVEVTPVTTRFSVDALRRPAVLTPLVSMVCAQLTMVAVMTMTPLQLHANGHGLTAVGLVLSAHMVGMFALAPLSGRIADRWGGRVAIQAGIGCLVVAAVAAVGSSRTAGLSMSLFLLGYGWNLVFVGGSSMLSRDLPPGERLRLQGAVDAVVWGSSAFASLGAGALFGLGGYPLVVAAAGVLALTPVAFLARRSPRGGAAPRPLPASEARPPRRP